jgi:putative ABC transport system permease protein
MTFNDAIGLSLRNLRQSRLRTLLTTLGVAIGIASLAGMISLGIGMQDQVIGRFTQSGLFGSITVTSQADLPGGLAQLGQRGGLRARGARGERAPTGRSEVKLDDDAIKRISALQQVREVTPNLRLPVEATFGEFSSPVIATATPMSSKGEGVFQTFAYGEFFRKCLPAHSRHGDRDFRKGHRRFDWENAHAFVCCVTEGPERHKCGGHSGAP